ncbi:hypothetical protein BJP36_37505 [Moorena producens JHB]|uniref:Uncharacterized protein n=1 Tax=Moorena producens (strain JHB) TaxID=1454205 RepID=A0A9Q9SUB3_MOOP1|nr:hypothetical protein [Moorena producens]WAN69794.1 hypothetical protein BJP36_37505 [Moorena producens JHB]
MGEVQSYFTRDTPYLLKGGSDSRKTIFTIAYCLLPFALKG